VLINGNLGDFFFIGNHVELLLPLSLLHLSILHLELTFSSRFKVSKVQLLLVLSKYYFLNHLPFVALSHASTSDSRAAPLGRMNKNCKGENKE